jgi:hypothetical protein
MRTKLDTPLALVCALQLAVSQAQTPAEPLEEIVVTGEFAGPGLWQITHPDHPGHTLWIVGEPPLLPKGMRFRSDKVLRVATQSQEILQQTGFGLKPDKKVGVLRMLTLVPAAMRLRKNPDKATLQKLLPPDLYARWMVQKQRYLGRDAGIERMRPIWVAEKLREAALAELQLGQGWSWGDVWQVVKEKNIRVTNLSLEFTFQTEGLRRQLKTASRQKLDDTECFARTVALTEALANKTVEDARARAWATGDLARLRELPPLPDPDPACEQAIVNALAMTTAVPADVRQQMDDSWFSAARRALDKNESTLAFVPMSTLIGENGYLDRLSQRGHDIVAPARD